MTAVDDCALLIGPAALLLKRAEAVRVAGLRPALLCTDLPDLDALPRGLRAVPGELADLRGSRGAFQAQLRGVHGPTDLGPLSFHTDGHFDWVLDFTGAPPARLPPPGHYSLAADDFPAFKAVLLEIAALLRADPEAPPAPAPPSDIHIAAERCTLCGVCVHLCASGALSFPGDPRQIVFTPAHCVSCGLCVRGCPEQAVTLTPLPPETPPPTARIVAESDLFACTGCGQPFAPRALIERSRALMADHPMFQGTQARLISLCPNCRQREMAGVAGSTQFGPDQH